MQYAPTYHEGPMASVSVVDFPLAAGDPHGVARPQEADLTNQAFMLGQIRADGREVERLCLVIDDIASAEMVEDAQEGGEQEAGGADDEETATDDNPRGSALRADAQEGGVGEGQKLRHEDRALHDRGEHERGGDARVSAEETWRPHACVREEQAAAGEQGDEEEA